MRVTGQQWWYGNYWAGAFNMTMPPNAKKSLLQVTIGGVDAPVQFAGIQPQFPGLDQLNVQLPASLKGRGEVQVVFTVDGLSTNPVTINVR